MRFDCTLEAAPYYLPVDVVQGFEYADVDWEVAECDLVTEDDCVAPVQQQNACPDRVHPRLAVEILATRHRLDWGGAEGGSVRSCFVAKTEAVCWAACRVQTNSIVKGNVQKEKLSFRVELIARLTACSHAMALGGR